MGGPTGECRTAYTSFILMESHLPIQPEVALPPMAARFIGGACLSQHQHIPHALPLGVINTVYFSRLSLGIVETKPSFLHASLLARYGAEEYSH